MSAALLWALCSLTGLFGIGLGWFARGLLDGAELRRYRRIAAQAAPVRGV